MSVYTPSKFRAPTGSDDVGMRLGVYRLPDEDISNFRNRILLESRLPSGPTRHQFYRSLSRKVGEFDDLMGRITLAPSVSPADAVIKVTASRLLLYSDYANGTLDVDLQLTQRGTTGYFLTDVVTAINASTNFRWTWVADSTEHEFSLSKKLMVCDNIRHNAFNFLPNNYVVRLNETMRGVPNAIWSSSTAVFKNKVANAGLITEDNDFALEYDEGYNIIITSGTLMENAAFDLEWREFPFDIRLASVRAWAYNDPDSDHMLNDYALDDDTGLSVPKHMNSLGAEIAHAVLEAAPLEWGE